MSQNNFFHYSKIEFYGNKIEKKKKKLLNPLFFFMMYIMNGYIKWMDIVLLLLKNQIDIYKCNGSNKYLYYYDNYFIISNNL